METIGSLVDKITIQELKRYHMEEQINREDASAEHIEECISNINSISMQKSDLEEELTFLFGSIFSGEQKPRVNHQFKMYNDVKYRVIK